MGEMCCIYEDTISDLKKKQDETDKSIDEINKDRYENAIVVRQIAESLPKLEKAITEFSLTMVNVNNSLSNINNSYISLEKKVDEGYSHLDKKIECIEDQFNINWVGLVKTNFIKIIISSIVGYGVITKIIEYIPK